MISMKTSPTCRRGGEWHLADTMMLLSNSLQQIVAPTPPEDFLFSPPIVGAFTGSAADRDHRHAVDFGSARWRYSWMVDRRRGANAIFRPAHNPDDALKSSAQRAGRKAGCRLDRHTPTPMHRHRLPQRVVLPSAHRCRRAVARRRRARAIKYRRRHWGRGHRIALDPISDSFEEATRNRLKPAGQTRK